jgi:hypothetical protein
MCWLVAGLVGEHLLLKDITIAMVMLLRDFGPYETLYDYTCLLLQIFPSLFTGNLPAVV